LAGGHFLLSIYAMGGKSSNLEEKSETSGTHKGLTYTYIGYEKYKRISSILKRKKLKIVLFVLFPSLCTVSAFSIFLPEEKNFFEKFCIGQESIYVSVNNP
jgi:hypothetical protein